MRLPLLLLLITVSLAASARAEDDTLVARLEWEPGLFGSTRPHTIPFKSAVPKDTTVPEGMSGSAVYARIVFGGSRGLSLALEPDESPPRVWIDTDLDLDLKDEKPSLFQKRGTNWYLEETVLVPYDGEAKPVPIEVQLRRSSPGPADRIYFHARIHRKGDVEMAGRLRPVVLVDGSSDARFDNAKKDVLYLDLDGDGQADRNSYSTEIVRPGEPFRVGDEGWVADTPVRSGATVTFRRLPKAPEARPKRWRKVGAQRAGRRASPPTESLETLTRRAEDQIEKKDPQRSSTLWDIGRVGTPEALAFLRRHMKNRDAATASAAIRAMGYSVYREAHLEVTALARTSNVGSVVSSALQALHGMDAPGLAAIYRDFLSSSDQNVAGTAACYLAYVVKPEMRQAVIEIAKTHSNDYVRYRAYSGIRTFPEGPPVDLMLAAAADSYGTLRRNGLEDLFTIGHPRVRELALAAARDRPVNASVLPVAARILASFADAEAVKVILPLCADPAASRNRAELVRLLSLIRTPDALGVMIRHLRSKDAAVRAIAAEILGGIPREEIVDALVKSAGGERDPAALMSMLEALGNLANERAVAVLMKMARKRDRGVRGAAIRALARLQAVDKKVRAFFVRLLDSAHWEDRVLAIDIAAASGDVKLASKVIANLDHDEWPVRLAAIQALGQLRVRASVLPLIRQLEKEEQARLKNAIAAALFRITGVNLYDQEKLWRRWWEEHGKDFEIPEKVPVLPPEDQGGSVAGFYGIPVDSGRAIFVIDQSGSMSAAARAKEMVSRTADEEGPAVNRLDVAVKEVLGAVAKMKSRDRVNVIMFHSTIHPWRPTLQRLTKGNRAALKKYLLSLRPTGGTNIYDALEKALQDKDVDTIFLLSDGSPGSGKFVATNDIVREIRRLNQTRRVAIHCVSIGRDAELMKRLAAENGGEYVRR
jgi:HEAT repeat protein